MKEKNSFFGDDVLLHSPTAVELYSGIASLPIIDYHSHLSEREIAEDRSFSTITEFWLKGDHYKWRAMRSCGVDEKYVTGGAEDYEKFLAYAGVMPKLIGSPLYYWTHLELKKIFGINLPLNAGTASSVYEEANEKLKALSVRKLLKLFKVEYLATTDDPLSNLDFHGNYDGVCVRPTFRPDKALKPTKEYIDELGSACGKPVSSLSDFEEALKARLNYFISKGCTIADASVEAMPETGVSKEEASALFLRLDDLTAEQRHRLYSYNLALFAGLCKKYGIALQLHIGALRNINSSAFKRLGADAGYDVMRGHIDTDKIAALLEYLNETGRLPKVILYTLNKNALEALCTIAPCFPNVRIGAAWWFNDTLKGIKSHLESVAEYSVLGTSLGMLTDSRSFSSYCRFDFFRRILADFVAEKVDSGEYDENGAKQLLYDICYSNPKRYFKI